MNKSLYLFCFLSVIPFLEDANAQSYLWPNQSWQERDLINPAFVSEEYQQYQFPTAFGVSVFQNTYHAEAGNWQKASLCGSHILGGKGTKLLIGGNLYMDKFVATKFTYGSFRIGGVLPIGNATLGLAMRAGFEQFSIRTSELLPLEGNDPLQNSNPRIAHLQLGAGVFLHHGDTESGYYAGASLPYVFQPDMQHSTKEGFNYHSRLNEWHGILGKYFYVDNNRIVEIALWGKPGGGNHKEGSVICRYKQGNAAAIGKQDKKALPAVFWAGAGYSSYRFLRMEVGCLLEDVLKLCIGYDYSLAPVRPVRSETLQITLSWVGGKRALSLNAKS